MNELPLALQQLVNMTVAELGLGNAERSSVEIAIVRAYNMGLKKAHEIINGNPSNSK